MLIAKFESIRMKDDKNFFEVYVEFSNIVIPCFNLGETIFGSKVVRKILRSLLKRFIPIMISIDEIKIWTQLERMNL